MKTLSPLQQALASLDQSAAVLMKRPATGLDEFAQVMITSAGHLHDALSAHPYRAYRSEVEDFPPELATLTTQLERVRRLLAHAGQLAGEPPPDVAAREASGSTILAIG
ncbi:MAG: hypothetical protein NTZ56_08965 [Acidobacteria bacterium]|nr:hypothetical protein [Acidobacteriota bacterium]